jgi:hypothetical protein
MLTSTRNQLLARAMGDEVPRLEDRNQRLAEAMEDRRSPRQETLFPGSVYGDLLRRTDLESTRVLSSFTMIYEDERTKVVLLGWSHVERSRFKRLVGRQHLLGQICLKRCSYKPFWELLLPLLIRFRKSC